MRGHLRQRKAGVWELIVSPGNDPLTGKRRQISRTYRGSKRDAEHELARLVLEFDSAQAQPSDVTLGQLLDHWLDVVGDDLSPTTVREYQRLIERRIRPALGSTQVRKITPARLDDFYAALRHKAGLGPSSVRQVHAVIRRALGQAVRWRWIKMNPAAGATPPRPPKSNPTPPALDQVAKLIDEAERTRPAFAAFLRLAAATGLRRGELCALRWTDFDASSESLVVAHAVVQVDGRQIIKDTKTHAIRRLALDPATAQRLAEQRQAAEKFAQSCGTALVPDAFIFSEQPDSSAPWHPDSTTAWFRQLCNDVGLTGIRLHDLRHMHATQLLAAGIPVRTVSGRLGHANAATTLNVYAHFLQASDQTAAETIGALLDPPQSLDSRPST